MKTQDLGIWTPDEARAWDLVVPRSQTVQEVAFLTWVFGRFTNREVKEILDLGCGTGRLAIELASKGYVVTGTDKFSAMLKLAKTKAQKRGVGVRLVRTSLDQLNVPGSFDAAYSVQDPFNYLLEEKGLAKALAKLRSLIRPGGLLVLDMANFVSFFADWKKERKMTRRGSGWSVRKYVVHEVDDVNMLWHHIETNEMNMEGKTRIWKETHILRMWTFPEVRAQLLSNGFTKVLLFGELKAGAREAKTHARRLVVVAIRD